MTSRQTLERAHVPAFGVRSLIRTIVRIRKRKEERKKKHKKEKTEKIQKETEETIGEHVLSFENHKTRVTRDWKGDV